MEIKSHTRLSAERDGRQIVLDFPADTPMGSIFDVLMEFKGFMIQKMAANQDQEEEEAAEKMKEEDSDGSDS